MIRFFRQIRYNSFVDSRFTRYLLYAIGEIILVVIGIFLALQLNTWNQERQNRAEERKYLLRLEQDLKQDLLRIGEVRENYETRLVLAMRLLDYLPENNSRYIRDWPWYADVLENYSRDPHHDGRSLGEDLFSILVIQHFAPKETTMQELLSSGKINLISDDSLKIDLQYHYPYLKGLDRFQNVIVMEVQRNFRNTMNTLNVSSYNHSNLEGILSNSSKIDLLTLALENYLSLTTSILTDLYYGPESVHSKTSLLIKRVQDYLNAP